jgi:hypothetical protein
MFKKVLNAQVSDTTSVDSSKSAKYIIINQQSKLILTN